MTTSLQTIAWQGFSFKVPREWNLTLHRGNAKVGNIVLSDLHQTQLEVRWHTLPPQQIKSQFNRLLKRLTKYSAQVLDFPLDWSLRQAHRIDREDVTMLLLQSTSRLYELSLQRSTSDFASIARSFRDHTAQPHWPWQLYGISGNVPKTFRLRKTTLLPGRAQLDFSSFRYHISLGSWSMADRVLSGQPLRQWAGTIPLVKNNPAGHWQANGPEERFTVIRGKLLSTRSVLTLTHIPEENVIRWQQAVSPTSNALPHLDPPHL